MELSAQSSRIGPNIPPLRPEVGATCTDQKQAPELPCADHDPSFIVQYCMLDVAVKRSTYTSIYRQYKLKPIKTLSKSESLAFDRSFEDASRPTWQQTPKHILESELRVRSAE